MEEQLQHGPAEGRFLDGGTLSYTSYKLGYTDGSNPDADMAHGRNRTSRQQATGSSPGHGRPQKETRSLRSREKD